MGGRKWSEEELEYLEEHASYMTFEKMAKKLNRSKAAVACIAHKHGIRGILYSTDMLTISRICDIMGVTHRTVMRWHDLGLKIHGKRKYRYKFIKQQELIVWMEQHQDEWDSQKIRDDTLFCIHTWFQDKRKSDKKRVYHWSEAEVSALKTLLRMGYSSGEISTRINRTETAIRQKIMVLRRHGELPRRPTYPCQVLGGVTKRISLSQVLGDCKEIATENGVISTNA